MKLLICPSTNDLENLQVSLVAIACKTDLEKSDLALDSPMFPYVLDPSSKRVIFGVNAIVRYLFALNKTPLNCLDEDILDIDEFGIRAVLSKNLKNKVPLDRFFCGQAAGLKSADKKTSASLEEALDSILARLNGVHSDFNAIASFMAVGLSISVCLKLLPPATIKNKFAALEPFVTELQASELFNRAVVLARGLSAGVDDSKALVAPAIQVPDLPFQHVAISDGLNSSLRRLFADAISRAFPIAASLGAPAEANVSRCTNMSFGDFQCNTAMGLSKALKGTTGYSGPAAPKDVAAVIVAHLAPNSLIKSTTVMPNGFINIHLSNEAVIKSISSSLTTGITPPNLPKKKILVDFSSPNIAKEMHVGHLRSTIIGDTLCRVFEFCGHDVLRVNHVGDWGTQFGMLITHLQDEYPDIMKSPPNISDLTLIYKAAKKRFDAEEEFKERSRLNVVRLQAGDVTCRTIWNLLCDISRAEFQVLYDALGIRLTEVGESFYNPMIPSTLELLAKQGLINDSEGMKIIMLPGFDIPLIVRKSDGGYGYDSTDMAAIHYRLKELDRDWLVYITDAGQSTHFEMIFSAARAAGWVSGQRLNHIGFGVVQGDDGKKFKTRSSETVKLMDLLNAARDQMKSSLEARAAEGKTTLSGTELLDAATKIGYGAVKYFDLKQNPLTNYVFSYERMLDTRGDTAVYLMFAYARVASILRKAHDERNIDVISLFAGAERTLKLDHPAERALAFELMLLGDVITVVHEELSPNRLCDYLSEISVKFTDFVTKCQVLNSEECQSRLLLCEATKRVMATCFDLLGINTLERI